MKGAAICAFGLGVVATAFACTGDDPQATGPSPDGGVDASSSDAVMKLTKPL